MLFLLNNVVFDLEEACPAPSRELGRFAALDLDAVISLGCELYAEEPLLHQVDLVRARRLAWLISYRCEGINAALFCAPEPGCNPLIVEPRFCTLPEIQLEQLKTRQVSPARHAHGRPSMTRSAHPLWGLAAA